MIDQLSRALLLGVALLSLPVMYTRLARFARFVVTALPVASASASVSVLVAGRLATMVWAAFGLAFDLAPVVAGV